MTTEPAPDNLQALAEEVARANSPWTDTDRASWTHATTLQDMRDWWKGSDCIIVAAGDSGNPTNWDTAWPGFQHAYATHWTIGCNRAARYCLPDFTMCMEPRKDTKVWTVVSALSALPFVLSHIPRPHPRTVLVGEKGDVRNWIYGPDPERKEAGNMNLGQSTFYAMAAAIVLGFETIGVIGLDIPEGRYPGGMVLQIEAAYAGIRDIAEAEGRRILNLNPVSRLKALATGGWEEVRTK